MSSKWKWIPLLKPFAILFPGMLRYQVVFFFCISVCFLLEKKNPTNNHSITHFQIDFEVHTLWGEIHSPVAEIWLQAALPELNFSGNSSSPLKINRFYCYKNGSLTSKNYNRLANTARSAICSQTVLRNSRICLNSKTNLKNKYFVWAQSLTGL